MTEDNKVYVNEILDEIDQLLTEEDLEGEVSLWDLVLESLSEVVEDRTMNGNNEEYKDEAFAQIEFGRRYVAEDMRILASVMESFSKSGHSVAEWAEATYGVSPITGDSLTDMVLSYDTSTEKRVRPGERCDACSNMTKKELKKYDSCPSCGRSLFALKSRGW